HIISLWIVNLVGCLATPDVIYEVANREDIDLVLYAKVPVELAPIKEVVPKDITESIQPNLERINVRGAWKQGYTGQGVVIGVVDTGVRYTHLDLANHLWHSDAYPNCGFNVASYQMNFGHPGPSNYDTLTPLDFYGHGTHCAGITSADGTYGNGTHDTMGVAPSALIMSVPVDVYVHSPYPDTSLEKSMWFGIQFCIRPPRDTLNGADVITMSLGLISSWLPRRRLHREVEEQVLAAGIVHCVAAGNEGSSKLRVPGNCPPPYPHPQNVGTGAPSAVISVGATDNNDNIASFSSRGPTRVWDTVPPWYDYSPYLVDPDVCAPGVNILSTYYSSDQSYTQMSGTSMATPHLAGVCALMLSKNPYLTPRQIDSILERHAVVDLGAPGKDTVFGSGRVDCSLAVAFTPPPISHDVGVLAIVAPTGTIDSLTQITPACTVKNYGNQPENYLVRMKIGNFYNQTATVSNHSPGTVLYLTFPSYSSWPRGTWAVSCSTELSGDQNPNNDKRTSQISVRVRDVGCFQITSPPNLVDSGTSYTPSCSLKNYGTTTETYPVRFKIGDFYNEVATVSNHSPGQTLYLTFPSYANWPRGNWPVSCSTELNNDLVPGNDKETSSVSVRVLDVGTVVITSPRLVVDSGSIVTPACTVYNYGNQVVSYGVRFKIGNFYNELVSVSNHNPQEKLYLTFPEWVANQRGTWAVSCSTELENDLNPNNDRRTSSVSVLVRDVGVIALILPDTLSGGEPLTPACSVYNFGTISETYTCRLKIGGFYDRRITIINHPPQRGLAVVFPQLLPPPGTHIVRCSTELVGDLVPENNLLIDSFYVPTVALKEEMVGRLVKQPFLKVSPSPFRDGILISFALPNEASGKIEIYNGCGELVKSFKVFGSNSLFWDGRDEKGNSLPKGVYFYRLVSESFKTTTKALKVE
ncbi:MAG: S8 family serine peptidase, partial [candidate division WOR-3 bacterium]